MFNQDYIEIHKARQYAYYRGKVNEAVFGILLVPTHAVLRLTSGPFGICVLTYNNNLIIGTKWKGDLPDNKIYTTDADERIIRDDNYEIVFSG